MRKIALVALLAIPSLACELIASVDRSKIDEGVGDGGTGGGDGGGAGDAGEAARCGDGKIDTGEDCDDGPNNGASACGCTTSCHFAAQATACSDGNACNGAEVCDGKGKCAAPGPLDCDDKKADTSDFCVAAKGCGHLGFAQADPTLVRGNPVGGTEYLDACPAGRVLVGLNAEIGASFDKVQVVCGVLGVSAAPAVTIGASETPFPLRGANANTAGSTKCPPNQMVVGFAGRAGALVDQISLRCAPVTIASGDGGAYSAALGSVTAQTPLGGTGGEAFADTDCPAGSVAIGAHIQAGGSVDGFGLLCGLPTVN